jgi:hypothetical protein
MDRSADNRQLKTRLCSVLIDVNPQPSMSLSYVSIDAVPAAEDIITDMTRRALPLAVSTIRLGELRHHRTFEPEVLPECFARRLKIDIRAAAFDVMGK